MTDVEGALSVAGRGDLRGSLAATNDPYINAIPKVELHIHIEGIISADLKWKFSQRNNRPILNPRTNQPFSSLDELRDSHDTLKPRAAGNRMDNSEETLSFFEAYYGGFEALQTRRDYFDLAMDYYERAAAMNVRYAEIFFDPQGHTRSGTSWETMMEGFREAQRKAERELNVSSSSPYLAKQSFAFHLFLQCIVGEICLDHVLPPGRVTRVRHAALRSSAEVPRHDRRDWT